jgi:hypothetical protein
MSQLRGGHDDRERRIGWSLQNLIFGEIPQRALKKRPRRKPDGALFPDGRHLGTPDFFGFRTISDTDGSGNSNRYPIRSRYLHAGFQAIGVDFGSNDKHWAMPPLRLRANNVSIGEAADEYFELSFDSEVPSDDDFDLSGRDHPYLIVPQSLKRCTKRSAV